MDPARKRAILFTVALAAALLLASGLVYTSFGDGRDKVTASQLRARAQPGHSYILAGTMLGGSAHHQGDVLLFRVRDPKPESSVRRALHRNRLQTVSGGPWRAAQRPALRRPTTLVDHRVPVQAPDGQRHPLISLRRI